MNDERKRNPKRLEVYLNNLASKLTALKNKVPQFKVEFQKPIEIERAETEVPAKVQEKPSFEITPKMQAILGAMHYREKEILETLIEQGGKSTQARIYHATGMPTTTLSRWVDSLERRELVKTQRLGKLRRVELTDKFLGEEQ